MCKDFFRTWMRTERDRDHHQIGLKMSIRLHSMQQNANACTHSVGHLGWCIISTKPQSQVDICQVKVVVCDHDLALGMLVCMVVRAGALRMPTQRQIRGSHQNVPHGLLLSSMRQEFTKMPLPSCTPRLPPLVFSYLSSNTTNECHEARISDIVPRKINFLQCSVCLHDPTCNELFEVYKMSDATLSRSIKP